MCASIAALLMGALCAVGLGIVAVSFVVAGAISVYFLAQPERSALGLLVLLPFLVAPVRAGDFALFLGMPAALLIGLSLLLRCHGADSVRSPRLYGSIVVMLVLAMIASTISSPDHVRGLTRIVYVIIFATFAGGVGTAIASGRLSHRAVAVAFVAGATLAAVALIGQSLAQFVIGEGRVVEWLRSVQPWFKGSGGPGLNWHANDVDLLRAIFPFMSPPFAGQYMAMALIAAAWLVYDRSIALTPARLHLSVVAVLLISVALLLTFSRQAWIGAGVGMLVLTMRARRAQVLAATIPFFLIILVAPVPGGDGTFYDFVSQSASSKSGEDRVYLWNQALEIFQTHPALGVGPGQYSDLSPDPNRPFYAHNLYLDMLVELGLGGAILFVLYGLTMLATAWRRRATLGLSMLATYAVANFFDDTFYSPRNGLALAVAVALIAMVPVREQHGPPDATARGPDEAPAAEPTPRQPAFVY